MPVTLRQIKMRTAVSGTLGCARQTLPLMERFLLPLQLCFLLYLCGFLTTSSHHHVTNTDTLGFTELLLGLSQMLLLVLPYAEGFAPSARISSLKTCGSDYLHENMLEVQPRYSITGCSLVLLCGTVMMVIQGGRPPLALQDSCSFSLIPDHQMSSHLPDLCSPFPPPPAICVFLLFSFSFLWLLLRIFPSAAHRESLSARFMGHLWCTGEVLTACIQIQIFFIRASTGIGTKTGKSLDT